LFVVSLWHYDGLSPLRSTPFTGENYERYWSDPVYRASVWRTVELGFVTTILCIVIAYPVAYGFARARLRYAKLIFFLLLTPLFVSAVVRCFGLVVFLDRNGLVNDALTSLHIVDEPVRLDNSFMGAVIALVNSYLIFAIMPLYSNLSAIPPSYEEAAAMLGARQWRVWGSLILPLTAPGLIAAWVLVFSLTVSSYTQPALLGGPGFLVLPTILYQQFTSTLDWPLAAATGFVLLIVGIVCVTIPSWIVRRTLGGVATE
jgi:putative spermidine/putrescine transport system permease protein